MKISKLKVTLAVVIFSILPTLGACGKKQPPAPQQGPAEVGIVVIQPKPLELTTELPGRTTPYLVAEVRPQVNGIIKKRIFTEGTDVKAGELLYQIDPAPYLAALSNAKGVLGKAEANLIPASLKAERYKNLVASKAVSQQEYDDASGALKQAEAEVAAAKAAVDSAQINLNYTRVTAPISGRIGRSSVTDGALVTANQASALATIQQLTPIYVDIVQSSSELLKLKKNLASGLLKSSGKNQAEVKLIMEDGTSYPANGILKFSEVTVDQSTGSITLRAVFPNQGNTLLPGMFVRAVLEEGINPAAILVPQRGVSRNPRGDATVMIVGEGEKVEPRVITVVRTIGDNWLVSGGLKAGDRVIVEGLQKARPGAEVKAVPFAPNREQAPAATAPQKTPAAK